MNDEHAAARTDTAGEFASGPTLTPVRRRGESHLLALMLAAVGVFVAIAIAKPWGEGAPSLGASAATTSPAAEIAKSSTESALPRLVTETAQAGFIVVEPGDIVFEPGDSPATLTYNVCTVDPRGGMVCTPGDSPATLTCNVCTEDPRGGMVCTPGDSPATLIVVCTEDPRGSGVCTSADPQGLESVLPSPSAP